MLICQIASNVNETNVFLPISYFSEFPGDPHRRGRTAAKLSQGGSPGKLEKLEELVRVQCISTNIYSESAVLGSQINGLELNAA